MALRKYRVEGEVAATRSRRMRLVHDDDAPVASPALALQHSLLRATSDPLEHYERYPVAFRVGFPIVVSIGLWMLILRLI